ncbi:3-dehydroquinate synthase [Ornithinibacillus sp. L9]|uniref:3-dehydroquinate synthase n=1 Tax=Ornithinibacillus caprae TaxID=2678566 RepID=A0A6N8FCK1_9BACI|nr:3-dehydroquinate synthase [Ornithinibacillus caprae]MUK87273.1 3-dehydroquinate synthase [Ornithinibacillus caprae]
MKKLSIKSSSHSYPVYIGENIRFNLSNLVRKSYSSFLIITDENVGGLYLDDVKQSIGISDNIHHVVIPAGEQSKNIQSFYALHTKAMEYGLDRNSLIIALGGGVIGDLAGFVAATFMRGIDYIQVPTTILAHDSSVGGKVAINHELGKNLIGNFYSPRSVIYDVTTLHTLPLKEIRSGYAELIKEALLADQELFQDILQTNLDSLSNSKLIEHLKKGIHIKAKIVEQDERETGSRKYLNLGHTLGHGLEAELGYGAITHGEAVAIGLLFALYVSEKEFSNNLAFENVFHWFHRNQYPLHIQNMDVNALLDRMRLDKKTLMQRIQMILLKKISEPQIMEFDNYKLEQYITGFISYLNDRMTS